MGEKSTGEEGGRGRMCVVEIRMLEWMCDVTYVRDGPKRGRTLDVYGFSSFILVAQKTTL